MSKTSFLLIGIMAAALCYMGAVRAYQFYETRVEQQQRAEAENNVPFMHITREDPRPSPTTWQPPAEDIFMEQKPLSAALEEQQAKETIESIINDFRTEPALRQFNEDLKRATDGRVNSLDELSNQSLAQIMVQNPQIGEVIRQNLQNKDFARIVEQVFSNPQFQQSVQQLQMGEKPVPPAE